MDEHCSASSQERMRMYHLQFLLFPVFSTILLAFSGNTVRQMQMPYMYELPLLLEFNLEEFRLLLHITLLELTSLIPTLVRLGSDPSLPAS